MTILYDLLMWASPTFVGLATVGAVYVFYRITDFLEGR